MVCMAVIVSGALLPFFLHNVFGVRSKMFIGDGGTLMLGMLMVVFLFFALSSKTRCNMLEDIGICLGQAFRTALGEKRGIRRYGDVILPMDETLILAAADISGRGGFYPDLRIPAEKVGTFDTELGEDFFQAFAMNARCTLHIRQLSGRNSHHILEGAFKSVARSLRSAVKIDPETAEEVPSTKGVL